MEWITGEDILKRESWGLGARLINAYRCGLSPYRQFDGARMTTGSKCFNCTKSSPGYKPGFVDEQGVCTPIKLPDAPEISPFPPFGLTGLEIRYPPLELAMKIDPALVEHFFEDGEFVFHCGVFNHGIRPEVARLLVGVLGSDIFERLMLEGNCSDFDPMGKLDMGDRLKAAEFKLKEVKEYERRHGIGSGTVTVSDSITPRRKEFMAITTKLGTTWSQIKLRIVNNNRVEITIGENSMAPYNPKDLGFKPGRQGQVTMWGILESFAVCKGTLSMTTGRANMTNFRKTMKKIFPGVTGEPVKHYHRKHGYQCEFQISASEAYLNSEHFAPDKDSPDTEILDVMKNER